MKKGPAFMTGETAQTPPPSRFTPLQSQAKARVVPNANASSVKSKANSSSTPMRVPAHLNQSRLAPKKPLQERIDFGQDGEDTPKSSLTRDESMGTKMVRVSPLPDDRKGVMMGAGGSIGGQQASTQLLNHSIQISELQRQVQELAKANRHLTEISEQQSATIRDITSVLLNHKDALQKLEMLGAILGSLVPAPVSLTYYRPSPDAVIVSWESSIVPFAVQNYEVSLNGRPSGHVAGKSKRAILTPLDPNQEYTISVQAVSQFDDIRSVKSEMTIPALQDDGNRKENVDESMGERMNTR